MTFELKTLSPESVPRALAKAERYRLLNEPGEAESICLDALQVDADNQEVLAMLLLALTDQFDDDLLTAQAKPSAALLTRIASTRGRPEGLSARSACTPNSATTTPSAPPIAASKRLSVSSWRTRRAPLR